MRNEIIIGNNLISQVRDGIHVIYSNDDNVILKKYIVVSHFKLAHF